MSKQNVDADLWLLMFGIALGLMFALFLSIIVNVKFGQTIVKDDKICISGCKYRVISIDDLNRDEEDGTPFTIKINVNKL